MGSYDELNRVYRRDGKRMRLRGANLRHPEEDMGSRDRPLNRALQYDPYPPMRERGNCRSVTIAVPCYPTNSGQTITYPDRSSEDGDPDGLLGDIRAVHADCDDNEEEHDNVNYVEDLIVGFSEQRRDKYNEHRKPSDDAHDVFFFEEVF